MFKIIGIGEIWRDLLPDGKPPGGAFVASGNGAMPDLPEEFQI